MTVDWFLVDGPHLVPSEFAAWTKAWEHHIQLTLTYLELCDAKAPLDTCAEAERVAVAAKAHADRLEVTERDMWRLRSIATAQPASSSPDP